MSRTDLPLRTVLSLEPLAEGLGVSKAARGNTGFVRAYEKAGKLSALSAGWQAKRKAFIARHLAQAVAGGEVWFDAEGRPTRRHLALAMWAFSPAPGDLAKVAARGPVKRRGPVDRAAVIAEIDALLEAMPDPNTRGVMAGVYGSKFYREPPKGAPSWHASDALLTDMLVLARIRARRAGRPNPWDPRLDESFRWVHEAVRSEMPDAVERAIEAGAVAPLSYVGAGQYGIVICDSKGKAFKVARGEAGTERAKLHRQSLRDEWEFFRFAGTLPAIRHRVAKAYGYDEAAGVLIRECVQVKESRGASWGKGNRITDLHNLIAKAMRPYGFRAPEFKEDSYVMHPKRGLVLVDAGFASRDIGWSNARRARELLRGDSPVDQYEPSSVVHGLRMDAGTDMPAGVAEKLAGRLEAMYPRVNPVDPYWEDPADPGPHLEVKRVKGGFEVVGEDRYGTKVELLADTREKAEAIRSLFKAVPNEEDFARYMRQILTGKLEAPPEPAYHVTWASRLPAIARRGLVPVQPMVRGKMGRGGYVGHRDGKLYLTSKAGIGYWQRKADEAQPGEAVVVLRVPLAKARKVDGLGSKAAGAPAWYVDRTIAPHEIHILDHGRWKPIA